jgi:hypothetical protein
MKQVIEALAIVSDYDSDTEDRERAALAAWNELSSIQKECLQQLLFKGPVWDGDIISKSARGDLFQCGLAVRCCFKGEQGYTAATYPAYTIYRAGNRQLDELEKIAKYASDNWNWPSIEGS